MGYYYRQVETRIGKLILVSDGMYLVNVKWEDPTFQEISNFYVAVLHETEKQLNHYFYGMLKDFNLLINPKGTEFQKKIWEEVAKIPFGETRSYQDIAIAVGSPRAVRAVGTAIGKNPLPVIIPCHRVISKSGNLGGFNGDLLIKASLLNFEQSQ